jgi:hypothetical protein
MTLDEAIEMYESNAEYEFLHRQLAEWLKELKHLRNLVAYSTDFHCTIEKAEKELRIVEDKKDPCEDCISRQAAIRWVKTECNPYGKPTLDFESGKKIIKYLKQMPSVIPKGVTITDFADKCRECGREKVLDKIIAEIEQHRRKTQSIDPYDLVGDCLEIIDKYKGGSEESE